MFSWKSKKNINTFQRGKSALTGAMHSLVVLFHIQFHSTVSSMSDWRSRGHKFKSQLGRITFLKIDLEIISMVLLPLLLIQEGQLSVTDESMCTSTG